jgi:hypothetical protein
MEQDDVFSSRIRWLAVAIGLSTAALFYFLSPLAAIPALLPLSAALQPRLSDPGKRFVKWLIWVWAAGWTPELVLLAVLYFPRYVDFVIPSLSSLIAASALISLWLDVELIVDGIKRIRIWRSAPPKELRPVARSLWVLAIFLSLWVGWGLLRTLGMYHGYGDLLALIMSMVEAIAVVAFDISLIRRVVKLGHTRRANS